MLKHIILKEIADHIQKLRFLLTGAVVILMFAVSGIAFVSEYGRILDDYKSPEQRADGLINNPYPMLAMFVQNRLVIQTKPNPFWFCVNGGTHIIPDMFDVRQQWAREVSTSHSRSRENPLIRRFGSLDWIFLIGTLLSFMAVVLSYDSFSGEKEDGTLRLMLSNTVPRFKVLIGKFTGIFVTIIIPLLIGQLINIIIIQSSDIISLSEIDMRCIGFVVLLSWLLVAAFICIGLMVSSLTHSSASSIIILLFVWVMLTLIAPNSSGLFARIVYNLPRKEVVEQQESRIYEDADERAGDNQLTRAEKYRIQFQGMQDSADVRDTYRRMKFEQVEVARSFARLSPVAVFAYAAESVAEVGLTHHKNLLEQTRRYRDIIGDFILSEEQRISDNPLGILHYSSLPWKAFNSKAIPIFQEKPVSFKEGFKMALMDFGLLVLYSILFFAGAYVSFNRYDVR